MKVKQFLQEYHQKSKPYWQAFFKTWQNEAEQAGSIPKEILTKFIDLYPRGKQLRGALSVLGYQLAGGTDLTEMYKASIAIELLETSLLVADDVFDKDIRRRGVDTIHKQWEKQLSTSHTSQSETSYLSHSLAYTTCIVGFHMSIYLISRLKFDEKCVQKALSLYSHYSVLTGFGEALDIISSHQDFDQKQSTAQNIHYYKTVLYSAVLPIKFGALLANPNLDHSTLHNLQKYAEQLGVIFQIQDDIIGSFGDPDKTGKSNTQDIKEGRWTILVEILNNILSQGDLLSDSNQSQVLKIDHQVFTKLLSQPNRSQKEIEQIKDLMIKYKIQQKAQQKAQTHLQKAQKIIATLSQNPDHQDTLKNLLQFMLNRSK